MNKLMLEFKSYFGDNPGITISFVVGVLILMLILTFICYKCCKGPKLDEMQYGRVLQSFGNDDIHITANNDDSDSNEEENQLVRNS